MTERTRGRRYVVHGRVQGVSFRWFTQEAAAGLAVRGWVRNRREGTVEVEAWGTGEQIERFEEELRRGPAVARVDRLEIRELPDGDEPSELGFEILATA